MTTTELYQKLENTEDQKIRKILNRVITAQEAVEYDVRKLQEKAQYLQRTLQRLVTDVGNYDVSLLKPPRWGSLGEIQGAGVELDTLCGTSHLRVEELQRLYGILELLTNP